MKTLILIVGLTIGMFSVKAQDYKTAIGVRGGFSNGLTVKHFISESNSVEGILSTRWRGFNITGIYQFNNPLSEAGLNWYYGAGAHIGFWNGSSRYNNPWFSEERNYTVIGVDGMIGIEYTFSSVPFNISFDYKPSFNLIGHTGFWGDEFAFSFRFALK